jgi:hypothetical protein
MGKIRKLTERPEVCSPIQLVQKGAAWRLTINYKPAVNDNIENDSYNIPLIMPKLQKLSKFKYYDKFDLSNAFWSIPITDPVS